MSDLSLQIVRECFELHQFRAVPHWPMDEGGWNSAEAAPLLFIERLEPEPGTPEFLLRAQDLPALRRAVVEVRAWHADKFYPSVVENNVVLGNVASAATRALAAQVLRAEDAAAILVVSELPRSPGPRQRSLELFRSKGIDHVLEFPTLLGAMLERISPHGSYAPSPTLQAFRLLKRYGFLKRQQLEFEFPARKDGE
ncbi:MAG: hypothetical protein GC168_20300 [Candidatus Hydrogenedens sp.]|nr:hypothetical protein [Candidatus Hydrogenedens sp.]